MSTETERLKREMYENLELLRAQKKHPKLLGYFEGSLELYLDNLRIEHDNSRVGLNHANRMFEIYSEAFDSQKMRSHNALVEGRKLSDYLRETRRELASAQNDRDETYESLEESTAKLASQTETIESLHRVVKDQQEAQARLQRGLDESVVVCGRTKAEAYSEATLAQSEIMRIECLSDELFERLLANQKLIVAQRKAIETLTFELVSARKQAEKQSFWGFLKRKSTKTQPLPKK